MPNRLQHRIYQMHQLEVHFRNDNPVYQIPHTIYCEKLCRLRISSLLPLSLFSSFPLQSYNYPSKILITRKKKDTEEEIWKMSCVCESVVKLKPKVSAGYRRKVQVLKNADEKQCNRTSHRNKNIEMKNYCAQNLRCAALLGPYFTVSEVIDREGPSLSLKYKGDCYKDFDQSMSKVTNIKESYLGG
ncbi:hypothetical protein EAF04_006390 [Stromatinia cepivora]|nr:hypothetical protein EAF04_006390 [Stromatinia cepivora]